MAHFVSFILCHTESTVLLHSLDTQMDLGILILDTQMDLGCLGTPVGLISLSSPHVSHYLTLVITIRLL